MKPGFARRVRCVLLILVVCWMALPGLWVARRWWALRIIEEEERVGLVCHWSLPGDGDSRWRRFLPKARVVDVPTNNNYALRNGRKLGWALRTCGPVQRLGFIYPANGETWELLEALGPQDKLVTLLLDFSESDQDPIPIIRQFPRLEVLSLGGVHSSMAEFPIMERLVQLQLAENYYFKADGRPHSQLTDDGLAAILRCPGLQYLEFDQGRTTKEALLRMLRTKHPALLQVRVKSLRLTREEEDELWESARQNPGVEFSISRQAER